MVLPTGEMAWEVRIKQEWVNRVQKTMKRLLWGRWGGPVGSYQKVRRYHVAETNGGHFMEGQSGQAKEFIAR